METRQQITAYDPAKPRRMRRSQREKGGHIYIAAAELRKAGIDPDGPPPTYKVWATSKGGIMVRLYAEG